MKTIEQVLADARGELLVRGRRQIPGPRHEAAVERLCAIDGWRPGRQFIDSLDELLTMPPWLTDGDRQFFPVNAGLALAVRRMGFIPDAFRLRVEEPPRWGWPVLAVEVAEVEVSNPVGYEKLRKYECIFDLFDATDRLHFRAFTFDGAWLHVLVGDEHCHDRRVA